MSGYILTQDNLEKLFISDVIWDDVRVLNYSQFNSPKTDPTVSVCRGLITDLNYNIISRPFDRFFNYGEIPESSLNLKTVKAFDKIDGTLIKIYFHNGWHVSTRANPYANQFISGFPIISFRDLVFSVVSLEEIDKKFDKKFTYMFELTSIYNKIVTNYGADTKLWYLMSRNNKTGEYISHKDYLDFCSFPSEYYFKTIEECLDKSLTLDGLKEGFVIYDGNTPILKIKSPSYIVAHRLRGNNTIKMSNIIELFASGELSEYLSYFPEHECMYDKFKESYSLFLAECERAICLINHLNISRKDIGLSKLDNIIKTVVFKSIDTNLNKVEQIIESFPLHKKVSLFNKISQTY